MAIKPVYENFRANSRKNTVEKQIKVQAKTELPTDGIKKVLDVSAFVSVSHTEVLTGKVKFNGKTLFNILYETEEGSLKKCEYVAVFSDEIEDTFISENSSVIMKTKIEKTGSTNDGKITLYAYFTAKAEICNVKTVEVLSGGEDLIVNKEEKEYLLGYGLKESAYPIEEEFELPYQVAEVLSHRVNTIITSCQCGVGSIIIDGETTVSALLLQNVDKSDIIKEDKTFPFRAEIEYDEAMPAMSAIAFVKENAYRSDIVVDEERGSSVVTISVALCFYAEAYAPEKYSVVNDAFSLTEKTEVVMEECSYDQPQETKNCKIRVNGRIPAPEIPAGSKIMAVGGERVEISSFEKTSKGLKVAGVLSLKAYFRDGDGKNFSVNMETPFEELTDLLIPEDYQVEIIGYAGQGGARIISFSEAELGADITLAVYSKQTRSQKYLIDVRSKGEKTVDKCAISLFIPTEGEDLWSLSKRLNVCPEKLIETNQDLQFPLTGKERILIYRQK